MEQIKNTETQVSFLGKILILVIVLYLGILAQKAGSKYMGQSSKSSQNQVDKLKPETKLSFKF